MWGRVGELGLPPSLGHQHPVQELTRAATRPSSPLFGGGSRGADVRCTQYLHFHVPVFLLFS